MLVTGKEILDKANKEGYAVGAFNFSNLEILKAIVAAAEAKNSPVIVSTSEGAIKYAGLDELSAMAAAVAKNASVPVALHLDHGATPEIIEGCIGGGWTSVMVDASSLELEENIRVSKDVVDKAHAKGVSTEAEIGRLSGIEDHVSVEEADAIYTNPDEAVRMVNETGVDSLAIAIGTAHGQYKGEPKLDMARLKKIKDLIKIPVVLHGSSGISEAQIKEAVSLGVNKINIDTDLRIAYAQALRETVLANEKEIDPRKLLIPSMKAVQAVVETKIDMFGSAGKA